MLNLLKTRIVLIESWSAQLKFIGAAAIYVFVFVLAYRPFNLDVHNLQLQTWIALLYSLTAFCVPVVFIAVRRLFSISFFDKNNWTIGKEILYSAIMILPMTVFFLAIDVQYNGVEFSVIGYIETLKKLGLLATLPIMVLLIVKKNMLLQNKIGSLTNGIVLRKNPAIYGQSFVHLPSQSIASKLVNIHSDNKSDSFKLNPNNFLFAMSEGNYVDIHYFENGTKLKKTIRSTIKKLSEDLNTSPDIIKCHRSYLVNTQRIKSVQGNSRGYKINLGSQLPVIPVARNFTADLKKSIDSLGL